jgi:parvulin-like peptidyl-prolyl isomerase
MMKKIPNQKSKLLITLSLIILLSSCQSVIGSKTSSSDASAIATYEGGQVTLKDATYELNKLISKNEKLKGLTFEKLSPEQKEAVIKEVILAEMAYKEAKKRKLDKDKDYQEALKSFESELLKQKLLFTLAKEAADEKNLRKNYDELVAQLKNKKDLRISYIALRTQKEADVVYQIVTRAPNSFVSQARKKSIDKDIAKKGGDLGFIIEDVLPADVLKQAKALQKGQIAKPFVANSKWVVIKLDDERPAEILSFEKAKDALAQNLAKKAMEDFASQSFEKAKISILVK